MCDCIKEVPQRTYEALSKQAIENGLKPLPFESYEDDGISGVALTLTSALGLDTHRLYTEFQFRTTFTKKDQTESKPKKNKVNLFFNFCPFCGKKYVTEDEVKEAKNVKK